MASYKFLCDDQSAQFEAIIICLTARDFLLSPFFSLGFLLLILEPYLSALYFLVLIKLGEEFGRLGVIFNYLVVKKCRIIRWDCGGLRSTIGAHWLKLEDFIFLSNCLAKKIKMIKDQIKQENNKKSMFSKRWVSYQRSRWIKSSSMIREEDLTEIEQP